MNIQIFGLCFLLALAHSQVPAGFPVQGPTGIMGPVPLPAMVCIILFLNSLFLILNFDNRIIGLRFPASSTRH